MSFELRDVQLGDVCQIKQGRYLGPQGMMQSPTDEFQIPVIGGNGILGYTNRVTHDFSVPLVTCRGSRCGLMQWGSNPCWVSNNAMAVFFKGGMGDNRFLFHYLRSMNFDSVITGSAQPQITITNLSKLELKLPPLKVQVAIGNLLDDIEGKLSENRLKSELLEQMTQTIFKSWFVDFDPVHAKARGAQPEGMDAETAALFPDSFVDSEIGEIPIGWRIGTVGDLGKIVTGKTPSTKKSEYWAEGHIPFITIPDLNSSRFPVRTQRFVSQDGSSSQQTTKLPPHSVVVSCIASPGLVGLTTSESHTNQQINAIVVADKRAVFWVLNKLIALSPEIKKRSAIGTVFPNLSKKGFSDIRIVLSPDSLVDAYSSTISSFVELQIHLDAESVTLSDIRDNLLPRLISGELEVPDELLGK
jgi:type I restriction enzyme S subunit